MGTSMHFQQNRLFSQRAVVHGVGAFVLDHGNTPAMVMHWLFGPVLNFATWNLFNSIQQEWFGLLPFEEFSLLRAYVVKEDA